MNVTLRPRVCVLGAGAWGSVLAGLAAGSSDGLGGREVMLWARRAELVRQLDQERTHPALPDYRIAPSILVTNKLEMIVGADVVVLAVPAQETREVCMLISPFLGEGCYAVIAAKGIEQQSNLMMHEVVGEVLPGAVPVILSGPGFADDVASGLPAAVTVAASDEALARVIADIFASANFRPYVGDDLIGTALGGAVKNVLAIAVGIVVGRGLGDSARAGLVARGLAELTRFGLALGARRETFAGLSGLGDLVLTANSLKSRNTQVGIALGSMGAASPTLEKNVPLAEGIHTAPAVLARASEVGVEMPICRAVWQVLTEKIGIDEAVISLLDRPLKSE